MSNVKGALVTLRPKEDVLRPDVCVCVWCRQQAGSIFPFRVRPFPTRAKCETTTNQAPLTASRKHFSLVAPQQRAHHALIYPVYLPIHLTLHHVPMPPAAPVSFPQPHCPPQDATPSISRPTAPVRGAAAPVGSSKLCTSSPCPAFNPLNKT